MESELLRVRDVAAAFEGWVQWACEIAGWIWLAMRLIRSLRFFCRSGQALWMTTPAGWAVGRSTGSNPERELPPPGHAVMPDLGRVSNFFVYSLAWVETLLYYCTGGRAGEADEGKPTMQLATGAVRRITGASQRQLTYWDATGLLKPSAKDTGHRRYTFPDVVAAKTIIALRQKGCSLQQIRKAVEYLRKRYPHDAGPDVLASLTLLTDGKAVYMLTDAQQVMDVVSKQTVWWIVNIGKLILEARQAMQTLPLEWVEPVTVRHAAYRLRVTHDADEGGYVVQCVELPGAIEQGETPDEAIENGKAAIDSVLAFLAKRAGAQRTRRVKRSA